MVRRLGSSGVRSVSGAESPAPHSLLKKGNRKGETQPLRPSYGQSSREMTASAYPSRPALLLVHFTEGKAEAEEGKNLTLRAQM